MNQMSGAGGENTVDNVGEQPNGGLPTDHNQTIQQQPGQVEIYHLRSKHQNLQSLYNEWYGLDEFDDGLGGIPGRDQCYGRRWRRHQIHARSIRDSNKWSRQSTG
jgi:hypothetical protein